MESMLITRTGFRRDLSLSFFAGTALVFAIFTTVHTGIHFYKIKHPFIPERVFVPGRTLPSSFLVDEQLLIHPSNQGPRGTCWEFQIIAVLEAQYKRQGVEMGYLKEDDYLKLAEEGLGVLMQRLCLKKPDAEVCTSHTKRFYTANSGSITEMLNFITEFPEFLSSVLPYNCCPYSTDPKDDLKCDDFDTCVANNPLAFTVAGKFTTVDIFDAKQRLVDEGLPLGYSMTMPMARYIFPCTEKIVMQNETCTDKLFRCPHDPTTYCSPHDFKIYKASNVDFTFQSNGHVVPGTSHAMLLVGYNDRFVPKTFVNFTKRGQPIGGFIIRNSWGPRGHTADYLTGRITAEQEARICPNIDDVSTWIPATFNCMSNSMDPSQCSTSIKRVRGDKIITGADKLTCKNETHCEKGYNYALLGVDEHTPEIEWSQEGVPLGRVLRWKDGPLEKVTIRTLPIQHLYYAFELERKASNSNECGYLFMPYDTLEEIQRVTGFQDIGGYWEATGLEVNWTKESFPASKSRFDYSRIQASMLKQVKRQSKSLVNTEL